MILFPYIFRNKLILVQPTSPINTALKLWHSLFILLSSEASPWTSIFVNKFRFFLCHQQYVMASLSSKNGDEQIRSNEKKIEWYFMSFQF